MVKIYEHHFNTNIASMYGVVEAILINNFQFWLAKNEADGTNFYDGRYWTYNSRKALSDLFPYLTYDQIRRALEKLVKRGVLLTGNYNKVTTDRTLWYSFTDEFDAIWRDCQMQKAELPNAIGENANSYTNNKHTDNIPSVSKETSPNSEDTHQEIDGQLKLLEEQGCTIAPGTKDALAAAFDETESSFNTFWQMYDKKCGRLQAYSIWGRLTKKDRQAILDYLPGYIAATPDKQYRMHPSTFLNPAKRHWEDEIINYNGNGNRNNTRNAIPSTEFLDAVHRSAEIWDNFNNS